jgi:acyl carrier protein
MTKSEFLERLADVLGTEPPLSPADNLIDFPEWDSMGQISIISFLDEALDLRPPTGALQRCKQVGDILELTRGKLSE